jgi:hypothetical protein
MCIDCNKTDEVTDCKWCGTKTHNTGTKECDRCWELRKRIEQNPDLSERILNDLRTRDKA